MKRLKKIKRNIGIWLLCLMQLAAVCVIPGGEVHAEETEVAKKIISVVYDDSGSMRDANDSWASANYAMQAFAALLNQKDEMYITYMSEVGTNNEGAKTVDLSDPQTAVDKIRSDSTGSGGTPLRAVEIAIDKLTSIQEKDESAQYWLIVLTDGAMSAHGAKAASLQALLDSNKGKTMSNGSQLLIYYMGIGAAQTIQEDTGKGLHSIMAGTNIVPALSEVANKVSGRMKFASGDITQVDSKTVKLHTELPLYNISVFSQNSKAKVTAARGENDYTVNRNVSLESPNSVLYGNAAVVTNGSALIQPGDCTLTFSEDISLADTVFMYQLVIEMKPVLTKNGVKLNDVSDVKMGDVIDIELIPTNPETGEEIPESKLPSGIQWGVSYSVDGNEIKSSASRSLTGVTVEEGENAITCTMKIPEYVPIVQKITFRAESPIVYGIQADTSDNDRYARSRLGLKYCKETANRYYITADGIPLTKDQLEEMELEIADISVDDSQVKGFLNRFGFLDVTVKLKVQDDGSFLLYPEGGIIPAFMLHAGKYSAVIQLNRDHTITAEGELWVDPALSDWIQLIPVLIILLLVLYILYIVFGKAKFAGQSLKIDVYKPFGGDGSGRKITSQCDEIVLHKYTLATFLPTRASTQMIPGLGIKVVADGANGVYFNVGSLNSFQKAGSSTIHPEHNFDGVVGSLKDTEKMIKDAAVKEIALGATPYYFKQGKRLYRVTVQ